MSAPTAVRRTVTLLGVCAVAVAAHAPTALAAGQAVALTASKTFSPAAVSVAPGDTVTWSWSGVKHNVTSDPLQADTFSSGDKTNGTFAHKFNTIGRFTYHCSLHSGMTGAVVVAAPGQPPDVTPPSAPTGLVATPGDTTVTLDWADVGAPDLANYVVERQAAGGPWSVVAQPITSAYTDTALQDATAYGYRVSAVDVSGNVSATSAIAVATPAVTAPPPPSSVPVTRHVSIANFQFAPAAITVNSGDTVAWDWTGPDVNHSVSAIGNLLDGFDSALGQLVSQILGPPPGGFSHTFNQVGAFSYICRVHPDMTGIVNVVASGAPATTAVTPQSPVATTPPAQQTATAARSAKHFNVNIANFAFTPPKLAVALGDVVTWHWSGNDKNHTVTSKAGQDETFESHPGLKVAQVSSGPAGNAFSHTFTHEGTFAYYCRVHPGMTAEVTVGPAPLSVKIAKLRRSATALHLSYRLSAAAKVRASVFRGAKRVATKLLTGTAGANSARIALPRSARRSALRVVLRSGGAAGPHAQVTIKARA